MTPTDRRTSGGDGQTGYGLAVAVAVPISTRQATPPRPTASAGPKTGFSAPRPKDF